MSMQSWKEEFYPVEANSEEATATMQAALQHSLRKWEGLSKKNLKKHSLHIYGKIIKEATEKEENYPYPQYLFIDSDSCALCQKLLDTYGVAECKCCPLKAVRGVACDKATQEKLAPYAVFIRKGNNRPMLELIKQAIKQLDSAEKLKPEVKHVKTAAFKELVAAVRAINPKAASYLNGRQIQQLSSFDIPMGVYPSSALLHCFIWEESKQGHAFWNDIRSKLIDAGK